MPPGLQLCHAAGQRTEHFSISPITAYTARSCFHSPFPWIGDLFADLQHSLLTLIGTAYCASNFWLRNGLVPNLAFFLALLYPDSGTGDFSRSSVTLFVNYLSLFILGAALVVAWKNGSLYI